MCEQCLTGAILYAKTPGGVIESPLPGWHLMRAQFDGGRISAGDWGLVRSNDPDVVWKHKPLPDPYKNLTDAQINNASQELEAAAKAFEEGVEALGEALVVNAETGYLLVKAATHVGYNIASCTFRYWLFDYLGNWVETHLPVHHGSKEL